MPWVRVDDAFYDHPKFIEAGPLGIALWIVALGWSNRNLTDGFIPSGQIPRLIDFDGYSWETGGTPGLFVVGEDATGIAVASLLVELGIFDEVPGGFQIHDYLDFQKSADQIRATREKERNRWQRRAAGNAAAGADSASSSDEPPNPLREDSAPTPRVSQPQPQPLETEKNSRGEPFVSDFDALWKLYPRKIDRGAALKAYQARRRDGTTHGALLTAVDGYAAHVEGTDQQFVKHGATFLGKSGAWSEWVNGPPEEPPSIEALVEPRAPVEPRVCPLGLCGGTGFVDVPGEKAASPCRCRAMANAGCMEAKR